MEQKIKIIVRIANTDLSGSKDIYTGLRKIKGINFMFSNAICNVLNLDKRRKVGTLDDKEIKEIDDIIANPKFPSWLLNRRKDYDAGSDLHISGSKLKLAKEFDIKRLKKIRSYRGMRHAFGLPVRGQKTRSHFRKGRSVGVQKKKIAAQKAAASKEDKKEGKK